MKKNVFLFSSPIQYFLTCLIIKTLKSEDEIILYYYEYSKNFEFIFELIDSELDIKPKRQKIEDLKDFETKFDLFIPNRFSPVELNFIDTYRKNIKNLILFEDGIASYLSHQFSNKKRSDLSVRLALRNFIKRPLLNFLKIKKIPLSHIYLYRFNKFYSLLNRRPNGFFGEMVSYSDEFKNLNELRADETAKKAIFLSQWLVEHELITEKDFIDGLESILAYLAKTYDQVFFKLHPREDEKKLKHLIAKYNIILLDGKYADLPVEFFLFKETKIDVYGFWSTTLFYAKQLLNLNAWSVYKYLTIRFSDNKELKENYENSKDPIKWFKIPELEL